MEQGDIISLKHETIGIYSSLPTCNKELEDNISPKHGIIMEYIPTLLPVT